MDFSRIRIIQESWTGRVKPSSEVMIPWQDQRMRRPSWCTRGNSFREALNVVEAEITGKFNITP
jgi:hypothetical protein